CPRHIRCACAQYLRSPAPACGLCADARAPPRMAAAAIHGADAAVLRPAARTGPACGRARLPRAWALAGVRAGAGTARRLVALHARDAGILRPQLPAPFRAGALRARPRVGAEPGSPGVLPMPRVRERG